jgi:hypothetical protein
MLDSLIGVTLIVAQSGCCYGDEEERRPAKKLVSAQNRL